MFEGMTAAVFRTTSKAPPPVAPFAVRTASEYGLADVGPGMSRYEFRATNYFRFPLHFSNMSFLCPNNTVVRKVHKKRSKIGYHYGSFFQKWSSEYGESMQILKFGANKSDYNKDELQSSSGVVRFVTILMYLSDVKQGGETVFLRSELKDTQAKEGIPSECPGHAVKPVKGNAILLFNLRSDGVIDMDSQYETCSVLEGEKWLWLAIKHIHLRKIDTPKSSVASDDECTDEDDRCVSWVAGGQCDRNPVFMIGSPDYYGTCRKSCRAC